MAIPTSRTNQKAEIRLYNEKCTNCGLCVSVCKDFSLVMENKKTRISDNPLFGCVGCGHCMAICPTGAVEINGRMLSPNQLYDLPAKESAADFSQLLALLQRRRSIREFIDKEVENDLVDKIIDAAQTAPMGVPPSDVNILIIRGRMNIRAFSQDFCDYLNGMKWFVSDWFLAINRPFLGKANSEMFRDFLKPIFNVFTSKMKEGIDMVNYNAPLAMYFYGSPYTDPADPIIAATYAMIAAESLGLGTCMLGTVHPLIQNGNKARKFRQDHRIKYASREGLFVIFGYPAVKYHKGIKRTFASVQTLD
ncbi:MAG: nitroreductase family protein [Bacteroidales bacterium]|jgi:ferredoxin|nr:nitroreductase family protein [Bacteroidales bacterium]